MHSKGSTVLRNCRYCGNPFLALTRTSKVGKELYCGTACHFAYRHEFRLPPVDYGDSTTGIPLLNRHWSATGYAIIDTADLAFVSQWRWSLSRGYVARTAIKPDGKKTSVKLHRELLGLVLGDGLEGDHINRNKLDHRRANLRVLNRDGNAQNRPSYRGSSSAHRGVSWKTQSRRWAAVVQVSGKKVHLGYFVDELDAARAAADGRKRLLPYSTD